MMGIKTYVIPKHSWQPGKKLRHSPGWQAQCRSVSYRNNLVKSRKAQQTCLHSSALEKKRQDGSLTQEKDTICWKATATLKYTQKDLSSAWSSLYCLLTASDLSVTQRQILLHMIVIICCMVSKEYMEKNCQGLNLGSTTLGRVTKLLQLPHLLLTS